MDASRTINIHCSQIGNLAPAPPGPSTELGNDDLHLWHAPIQPLSEFTDLQLGRLPEDERARAQRFHFNKDRVRFVIGHAILRQILHRYVPAWDINGPLARGPYGKPYLEHHGTLKFNFSDTRDGILIGVMRDTEIGVDLETNQREVDHQGVSEHFFSRIETAAIVGAGAHAKALFLEFWTRKEAILKATGVGIMDDVRTLCVLEPVNAVPLKHPAMLQLAEDAYHVSSFTIGADHIGSVAIPRPDRRLSCFDAAQLIRSTGSKN